MAPLRGRPRGPAGRAGGARDRDARARRAVRAAARELLLLSFRCAICGSARGRTFFEAVPDYEYGLPFETTLLRCEDCATVQQHPLPTSDDLPRFYPPDYHAYHYRQSRIGDWLKTRYSRGIGRGIRREIGDRGRILDLGCADGAFLAALEPLGSWELHGIDLNPDVVRHPRSPRLRLRVGQLQGGEYPSDFFDAIVATHLVEHVPDPLALLRVCHEILRPGGILVGELPSLDCWDLRVFGRHWGGLHVPRHLFFWDPASFRALGRRGGFAEVETHPMLQPAHWAISLQNRLVDAAPGLRRWLRRGRLPLYTPAVLAATPLCWLQNRAGRPSIMGFRFRK